MTVHLVGNPAARSGQVRQRFGDVVASLEQVMGSADLEVHLPSSAESARSLLSGLASAQRDREGDREQDRVVVAGGDGIVHLAVNALAGSPLSLGIVPMGTGNDAARGIGLPKKLESACRVAVGPSKPLDLIRCGDRWAITVAIVGLAVSINERAEQMRFPRGGAKYSVATFAELPRLQTHELAVTIDGVEHDLATNLLAIANLPYFGGGMKVAPSADATDGQLEIISVGPASRLAIATLLPTIFTGRHIKSDHVTVLRGHLIEIRRTDSSPVRMRADGEGWGELPASIQAVPAAIEVACQLT